MNLMLFNKIYKYLLNDPYCLDNIYDKYKYYVVRTMPVELFNSMIIYYYAKILDKNYEITLAYTSLGDCPFDYYWKHYGLIIIIETYNNESCFSFHKFNRDNPASYDDGTWSIEYILKGNTIEEIKNNDLYDYNDITRNLEIIFGDYINLLHKCDPSYTPNDALDKYLTEKANMNNIDELSEFLDKTLC